MSGAHGAGLVLDSNVGLVGSKCFTLYVCTVGLAQSSKALARAWGRLAMGAWCVCIEESHADE